MNILVMGASYGLVPAVRIGLSGHCVTVLCRNEEQSALVKHGATIELKRRDGKKARTLWMPVEYGRSSGSHCIGVIDTSLNPLDYDLAILAMTEPQFGSPDIAAMMAQPAMAKIPLLSVMNMVPPPFLRRLEAFDCDQLRPAYEAWDVWERLDPERFTASSPDAQAVRQPYKLGSCITVTLASNFKVAPFHRRADQIILQQLASDVERFQLEGYYLPLRLVAEKHLHVPLAKWPMLIAGNCRCLQDDGAVVSIAEAVRTNLETSRRIYNWVSQIVGATGADKEILVPFELYAAAAKILDAPSSLGRALTDGAVRVERIDRMVQTVGTMLGFRLDEMDQIVQAINARLVQNRNTRPSE